MKKSQIEKNTVILEVDEATKNIMDQIEDSIEECIEECIEKTIKEISKCSVKNSNDRLTDMLKQQQKEMNELKKQIESIKRLERNNKNILESIVKQLDVIKKEGENI